MTDAALKADAATLAASGPAEEAGAAGESSGGSSIYELFMGLMTIMSLAVMVLLVFVRVPQVETILASTDTLFCVIFLFDFGRSLLRASSRSVYLFGPRPGRSLPTGLVDLFGSVPGIGIFRALRIFRLARLARLLRAKGAKQLATEFIARRSESALYLIVILALLVLVIGSSLVAIFEPDAEGSNIKTGGDAFWWAWVTITTVGYGDRFPVTSGGRGIGMLTMAVGIGIFGVLTSFLSGLFLSAPKTEETAATGATAEAVQPSPAADDVRAEVMALRAELSPLRADLADLRRLLSERQAG